MVRGLSKAEIDEVSASMQRGSRFIGGIEPAQYKRPFEVPEDIDEECVALCVAMNKILGVMTTGSCCGHGERPFSICFSVLGLRDLWRVTCFADWRVSGVEGWRVQAVTAPAHSSPVLYFALQGPVGDFAGAAKIAAEIERRGREKAERLARRVPSAARLV